jgi:3-oxoacyl-[acyl-carrier-protein] synthase-1
VDAVARKGAFHPSSLALHCGKGGIAEALQAASALLTRSQSTERPRQVLLAGLDSLLVAGTVEQLIGMNRILGSTTSDGLVPAEGAASILLEPVSNDRKSSRLSGLHIEAAASAVEDWRLDGDVPARGHGLTQAVRAAVTQANTDMSDLDLQVSGANGEGWYAREVTLMQSRCMKIKRSNYPHIAPAQWLGDAGAAAPVLALAWLADIMGRDSAICPGRSALAHFAGDDGQRSALVLRHDGNSSSSSETRFST